MRIASYILTTLASLFLTFDTIVKLLRLETAVMATTDLGYPPSAVLLIGTIELIFLVLYVVPRTSVLGAILMTGYLGGAIATHVRASSPMLTHTLFPIYVAAILWAGLYLREARLAELLPLRR